MMSHLYSISTSTFIAGSVILAILLSLLNIFLAVGITVIIFVYLLKLNSVKTNSDHNLIFLIIIGFLTLTSAIGDTIRISFNILSILVLIYVFLKKYAFEFSKYPKLPSWIILFVLLVFGSMISSTLFSTNIFIGLNETSRQILFFIVLYIIYSFIDSYRIIYRYIYSIIIASTIISIAIIYSFISSEKLFYLLATTGLVTDAGYFTNQAAAGGILAVGIPLTLILVFSKENKFILHKNKLLGLLLFEFIALLLTNSRAAIFASIVSMISIIFIMNRRIFIKIFLTTLLFSFGLLIFVPQLLDILSTFFRSGRVFENTRYVIWDIAFSMYRDNPFFGVGPGLFQDHIYKYLPVMIGSWEENQIRTLNEVAGKSNVGIAHNFFVSKISELGILGFLTAILLPVLFFFVTVKLIRNISKSKSEYYSLLVGIRSIGVGLFLRSFFEVTGLLSYGWISRDLPFWILFAIVIFIYQQSKNNVFERNKNIL